MRREVYCQPRCEPLSSSGPPGSWPLVDASSPYASGTTVTVLANTGSLVKTGYTFAGWDTTADGTGTAYAAGATFTISASTTLYAVWAPANTVTYDGNGATGGTAPVDASSPYASGATVTVLANTGSLVKTGYTFAGWDTTADGTGTAYAAGATFTISASTTLYAAWTANSDTVTYDGNEQTGGTAPVDASSPYASGATVTVLGNTGSLVNAGYTFAGWDTVSYGTAANGEGTFYAPGATFTILASTTLYAVWTHNSNTVTYNGNGATGGTVPVDASSPYLTGEPVIVLGNTGSLVKTGYTFAGWNTEANRSGIAYAAGDFFTISANTTLYAVWTSPSPQKITFGALANRTLAQSPVTVTATASSGLTVTFTTTTPAICTSGGTNGATITLLTAGTCTVQASQAGNATYSPAPILTRSFTVSQATQKITFAALANKTLAQSPVTVTATASSGLTVTFTTTTPAICTSGGTNGATITLLTAGTCTIQASQAGNATYSPAPILTRSFTVSQATQKITFAALANKTLAQSPVTVTATASSGLTVTFTTTTPAICTSGGTNGATITLLTAGTCTIQASQAGNATYSPAPILTRSFTVSNRVGSSGTRIMM